MAAAGMEASSPTCHHAVGVIKIVILKPKGHSTMDTALACHSGGRGLNPGITKYFNTPVLLGTPITCTLSHTMPVVMNSSVILVMGEVKREE